MFTFRDIRIQKSSSNKLALHPFLATSTQHGWSSMTSQDDVGSGFLLTNHVQMPIFGCSYVE